MRRPHRSQRPRQSRFQSTHPRGVRPVGSSPISLPRRCFNPRTRVGCDVIHSRVMSSATVVSIHAPAWGATGLRGPAPDSGAGFNPRTRVGCDHDAHGAELGILEFQSTHPRGVRLGYFNDLRHLRCVSIHAPAWGATTEARVWEDDRHVFQSTHPRGVRLLQILASCKMWDSFNPRTRVGCDASSSTNFLHGEEFQSTHPRGVRPSSSANLLQGVEFQSTHPRGVRQCPRSRVQGCQTVSIHAPAWGATVYPYKVALG